MRDLIDCEQMLKEFWKSMQICYGYEEEDDVEILIRAFLQDYLY